MPIFARHVRGASTGRTGLCRHTGDTVRSSAKILGLSLGLLPRPPPSALPLLLSIPGLHCLLPRTAIHPRKKRSLFGYEGEDEPVTDLQQKFKVHFFNQILDFAIQSFNERFTQLEEHSSIFSILYNIPTIKDMDTAALTSDYTTLERALTYRDSRDIHAKYLCNELKVLSRRLDSEAEPLNTLEYITRHQMASLYPNAFFALRVLLTLPETVASGERTFSKLKLIKNYLRSTMSQERLNGLATISIEHELSYKINL
ncbi:hypothetical protein J4Q44_G00358840 [Coregonus suidteri]|uniref:HAT C-terminal dimerisation domain-containing protein n=1 Tax=Coregonus suidteri TaxID=861788 RepID=A0AAN8KL54_9TELE